MKKNSVKNVIFGTLGSEHLMLCLLLVFGGFWTAQAQEVQAEIDTNQIKIGEQITYKLSVEAGGDDLVVFPEGQTFNPLEMVEAYAIDTSKIKQGVKLVREYALTQFDSGRYSIPPQRVLINQREFKTDSFLVEVHNVLVDTTKQKMYPIKPSVEVPSRFSIPAWVWWLLALLVLGGLLFFYFRRKKKKAAAQVLPPYEQALYDLQRLDESHLLEQRALKEYYSQLSEAVRRYLDGEVYDHAMESTTGELIAYLKQERDQGRLKLEQETIDRLTAILQRADLAKFANRQPHVFTAKEDRTQAESVINETKASIPQPSEEELMLNQEYLEKQRRKKKVRKIVLAIVAVVLVLSAATAYIISTRGFEYFSDTYFGNSSKELLRADWVESEYGSPPVSIATPDVLIRQLEDTEAMGAGKEVFKYGSLAGDLYVEVNTRPVDKSFKLESALEEVYEYLEENGAKNILTKQEEFETLNGAKGLRVFGTMNFSKNENSKVYKKAYSILNFGMGEAYEQVVIIYREGDKYGSELAQRITNSVELIKKEN